MLMLMVTVPEPKFGDEKIRLMKRVEYDQLVRDGFLEDEKVELLFGMVVEMPPIDTAHVQATMNARDELQLQLGKRAHVRCQAPFAASDISEPEPDVYVTEPGEYWADHPAHAFLVIEVARSSLARDRGPKALLYGLSSVDEYWIVDQIHEVVDVYRERKADGSWAAPTNYRRGESIAMLAFPDVTIATDRLFPPKP
jgi:Uma2 family endonuclease